MFKKLFNQSKEALICVLLFLMIAAAYYSPLISGDKVMFQHDILQATGMAKESEDFKKADGEEVLWTNSMFSGMPTYQIGVSYPNNFTKYFFNALTYMFGYNRYPIASLWMLMTCFFLMALAFKVDYRLAAAVAVGYGLTSFNIIGIEAGHANKIWTLMYAPLIFTGIKLAFDKKFIAGGAITMFALAISIYANHLQITYYFFIAALVWVLAELAFAFKEQTLVSKFKGLVVLVFAAVIGIAANTSSLWTTYEYGKETTRGGTELTLKEDANDKGLDKSYVFDDYSNGRIEPFTFLIPNFMGGPSAYELPKTSEVFKLIRQGKDMPTYWGDQRYTAGPYYLGAILCFLFVLGIFSAKNNATKWWILIAAFLSLSLSMGKNSLFLSELFFNYFPLFSKFRTPTMIVGLFQLLLALLGAIGLSEFIKEKDTKVSLKKLNYSFLVTGGLCAIVALLGPSLFPLTGLGDARIPIEDEAFKEKFMSALMQDRGTMMRNDAFRSLLFVALAYGSVWLYLKNRVKLVYAAALLAVFMLIDQWNVSKRYTDEKTYKKNKKNLASIDKSFADGAILQDKDPNYRVLNLSLSAFNDATTSYYHKSIGGYHGAKLRRYQELIEYGITPEIIGFQQVLQQNDFEAISNYLGNKMQVLNMLNTKYLLINPEQMPLKNPAPNGNAWFVSKFTKVPDATAELNALKTLNLKNEAVVDETWDKYIDREITPPQNTDKIELVSYHPMKLTYKSQSTGTRMAVFSEIFYPYGWQAYLDGEKVDHFRTNYVLRAMLVPEGQHEIVFKFEPSSYYAGEKISLAGSLFLILGLVGALIYGALQLKKA